MNGEYQPVTSQPGGSKKWIFVGVGVVAILIIAAFFLFRGEKEEGASVGEGAGIGEGEEAGEGTGEEGAAELGLECEDIISRDFLETTFGGALSKYREMVPPSAECVVCNAETGEQTSTRGGSVTVCEYRAGYYESHIEGFRRLDINLQETNNIGLKSAEYTMLDIPIEKIKNIYFITSNSLYIVTVSAYGFSSFGEQALSYARAIAQEVNSNLSS